ncbi:unnamed protein product [Callosobruchus maculatus]|uniref:Uncharacterized protein n=1 Tax=Callosobruchus maculatus TaxID=64391 RepID=A0A653BKB1_CALMS|nr:unnamed protein product [Callosobruchus maculatus]
MKPNGITSKKNIMENSMMPRKSLLRASPKKQGRVTGGVSKRYKDEQKPKRKLKKMLRSATEWTENESSKQEIKRSPSTDSVIYTGSYQVPDRYKNLSVIDLTTSQEDLKTQTDCSTGKSIQTIYFPSRNFDRSISMRNNLTTASLVTLPLIKRPQNLRRFHSSSTLYKRHIQNKLSILDIPEQYLDESVMNVQPQSSKSDLNDLDHNMIDWILQHENDCSSGNDSEAFENCQSIEDIMKLYGVTSRDTFD